MKLQEIETVAALCGVEPASVEKKDEGFLVLKYGIRFWVDDFEYMSTNQGLQLVDPLDHEHLYGSNLTVYPADGGAPIFVLTDYPGEAHYGFFRIPVWAKTLGRADYLDYKSPVIGNRRDWVRQLTLAYEKSILDSLGEPRQDADAQPTVIPAVTSVKGAKRRQRDEKRPERLPKFNHGLHQDYYDLLGDYALLDKQIEELELRKDDELYYVVGIIERGLVLPMARLYADLGLAGSETPPDDYGECAWPDGEASRPRFADA